MTATKAPPLSEKLFQRQVVELAKMLGWRVYHPFLSKWSEKGFPDLTMVRARDRRLLFAELKAERGVVSPSQVEWQELLGSLRFDAREQFGATYPTIDCVVWRPSDWPEIERVLR